MISKIINAIKHPRKIIIFLAGKRIIYVSDKFYLKLIFKDKMHKKLDLNNPKSFNEKLQWLKLYDRKEIYTKMVDKYEVKKYISSIIGEEYIIPTIAVYEKFDEINFDDLPDQFVIKCNHDSEGLVICKDKNKLNIEMARKKINRCLKRNYFYLGREWPYKNVKPKIIIEKYMEDKKTKELRDYKFFCFDGEPKLMFIATDRTKHKTKFNYYDMDFNYLNIRQSYPNDLRDIEKPINFDKMIKLAKKLSKNIPHVRVDFYEINGKVYFGEMTFYHYSGLVPFIPDEWDYKIGEMLKIDKKR